MVFKRLKNINKFGYSDLMENRFGYNIKGHKFPLHYVETKENEVIPTYIFIFTDGVVTSFRVYY